MIVMKFGGTSVGNADRISNVANIVKSNINKKPGVVVSAVGGVTDKLIELGNASAENKANKILGDIKRTHYGILEKLGLDESLLKKDIETLTDLINNNKTISAKTLDEFQSFGEQMSSKIVAAQLNKIGVKADAFNAWDFGFFTNDEFGNAEPLEETFNNLDSNIKNLNVIPIVTGFVGKTRNGEITTLGRGGSDYSAAIIGSAINAEEIQIWTDVDGVMSTDPKVVSNAKTLDRISFAEASELAYFGAKVLHPKTILPAMNKNIPVRVLNSFNPKCNGTMILNNVEKNRQLVKAITYKKNIMLINVISTRMLGAYGFLARVFNIFDKYKKSVDVISTSEVSISLTIDNENEIDDIACDIEEIARVRVLKDRAVVCIVGEHMMNVPGIAGRTFEALGKNNINVEMISQASSGVNITFVVDRRDMETAVRCLHEEYYSK